MSIPFPNLSQEEINFLFFILAKVERGGKPSEEEMWKYLEISQKDHPMSFYADTIRAIEEARRGK